MNFPNSLKKGFKKFLWLLTQRIYVNPKIQQNIVEQFHKLYYDSSSFGKTWAQTFWFGVNTQKCPLDLWIYQEILYELKPDLIIETGTANGGSALFLATICDIIGIGTVVTIDIERRENLTQHSRIKYLTGSSTSNEIVTKVQELAKNKKKVMCILDSDHTKKHVLDELKIYSPMVSKGQYLIVEDTHVNGHPVEPEFGEGPMEAVKEFLKSHLEFKIDAEKEKFYLTFNPQGYIKKIA